MAKLYLIPNTLGEQEDPSLSMGSEVKHAIAELSHFAVENLKQARRYLVRWGLKEKIDQSEFILHNKKTEVESLLEAERIFKSGASIGMISDAGCPGIADPGNQLVQLAHRLGVEVVPLSGPSSIFLALMASGMNGQAFAFNGYLPREQNLRISAIRDLEKRSRSEGSCQILMETPYRNMPMLDDLIANLAPSSRLCTASNLRTANELVISRTISEWKKSKKPNLNKAPTIFLIQA
jgi:16S rRNA (cytidine1402-2'-O)-methyltransferase